MTDRTINVAVLGSTGSIGCSALQVLREIPSAGRVVGLSAHSRLQRLAEQAAAHRAEWVVVTDPNRPSDFVWPPLPGTQVEFGHARLQELISGPGIDLVVAGMVGIAGLPAILAALEAGKRVAVANKEPLVAAGARVMEAAGRGGVLLPLDSEHSAIFQALQCGRRDEVRRVILTASGGPFLHFDAQRLAHVTAADALHHPTWRMGKKITIDSATMMNKALEIVEARWLFDLAPEQIEVAIHPQSIVHSMVEFVDGSTVAQLSPPDMRLPIQYALTYPRRAPGDWPKLDFRRGFELQFLPPDPERFPALELGYEVARRGGSCGVVVNAANEAAVARFLAGQLSFPDIVPAVRAVLDHHPFDPHPSLDEIFRADQWARQELLKWTCR